jgi:glycosyltransferase involved in cell wall biosynthesis
MPEILSISIPTRNRADYLQELLASIRAQLERAPELKELVRIYLFDNASTDHTDQVPAAAGLDIRYKRNSHNILADPNIHQAYTSSLIVGDYIWVIGDDELLAPDSISHLLDIIREHNPILIVNFPRQYNALVDLPFSFPDYGCFARFATDQNPHLLIAHSLISANVIRRRSFAAAFAEQYNQTHYGHFYGIIEGVGEDLSGPVLVPEREVIIVRERRAPVQVAELRQTHKQFTHDVHENQLRYLNWVKQKYALKQLKPDRVLADYGQKLRYGENPTLMRKLLLTLAKLRS